MGLKGTQVRTEKKSLDWPLGILGWLADVLGNAGIGSLRAGLIWRGGRWRDG